MECRPSLGDGRNGLFIARALWLAGIAEFGPRDWECSTGDYRLGRLGKGFGDCSSGGWWCQEWKPCRPDRVLRGSGNLERACGRAGLVTLGEAGSEGGLGSVGRELGVTGVGTLLPRPFGGGFVEFGSGGCEGRIVAICVAGTEV
jgi:hypothetical protein